MLEDADVLEGPSSAVRLLKGSSPTISSFCHWLVSVYQQSLACQWPFFTHGFSAADPA